MAIVSLNDTQRCNDFLQHCIRTNLTYWQDYVEHHTEDAASLDQEWEAVIKAITLGLELVEGWPLVYPLIINFSSFMERRGYWDIWQTILGRGLKAARQANDEQGQMTLAALSARLWQRQGNYQQMITHYRYTIRLARRQSDRFNEGRVYTNLGYFYVERGQWYRAEILCCHALGIFDAIDNNHGRAHTYNHLGALYIRQRRWNEAKDHLSQAYAIWQATEDDFGLMSALVNFGTLYIEMGSYQEGHHYSQQALQQAQSVGDELTGGHICINIGAAYRLEDNMEVAERYIRQAETVFQRYVSTYGLALVYDNLGLIYLGRQQWDESKAYLQMALNNWQGLGNKPGEIRALAYLAQYAVANGNEQNAEVWLKDAEQQLVEYDQVGQYQQLHEQVNQVRHSLTEAMLGQTVTK